MVTGIPVAAGVVLELQGELGVADEMNVSSMQTLPTACAVNDPEPGGFVVSVGVPMAVIVYTPGDAGGAVRVRTVVLVAGKAFVFRVAGLYENPHGAEGALDAESVTAPPSQPARVVRVTVTGLESPGPKGAAFGAESVNPITLTAT